MFEILTKKNKDIKIYSVYDSEFDSFGRIIENIDISEIEEAAAEIKYPESSSCYSASVEAFENLKIAEVIKNELFGTLPTQIGFCYGHNNFLNATEWHTSSEVNIAITPLVLILGHIWDIKDGKINSSEFKAFYLPAGTVVEVYSTSLHFCPCETQTNGFGCVVALPSGTNTDLETEVKDPLMFRKNKWIMAHEDNKVLIERGVKSGISGINYEIKY